MDRARWNDMRAARRAANKAREEIIREIDEAQIKPPQFRDLNREAARDADIAFVHEPERRDVDEEAEVLSTFMWSPDDGEPIEHIRTAAGGAS
jgi:hypothetical protein